MRVWDVLFYEGAQVLFNVALAVFMVMIIRLFLQFLFSRFNRVMLMLQMKEEELLMTYHVGDVIKIIQNTTHHLFDPDDLLTVKSTPNI